MKRKQQVSTKRPRKKKPGGFLPLIIPAIGAIISAISGITNAALNAKANQRRLQAIQNQNQIISKLKGGSGLRLKPYPPRGQGLGGQKRGRRRRRKRRT